MTLTIAGLFGNRIYACFLSMKDLTLDHLLQDPSFSNWVHKSNKNDVAFWELYIKNNPDKLTLVYTARDIMVGIHFSEEDVLPEAKVNAALDAVMAKIDNIPTITTAKETKSLSLKKRWYTGAGIAAIFLLILSSLFLVNLSNVVIHKTGYGEIIQLKLADGSEVILNGNSELKYNEDSPRDVSLVGEAYFKVKPKYSSHAKFWVHTKDLRVEVYGTQFNVNTRDHKTGVMLDEGAISLSLKNGDSKKMKPGDYVSYSNEENIILEEKINDSTPYAVWRDGTYVFNEVSLGVVINHLEHVYGVKANFVDAAVKERTISGGIPNENLELCLTAIEKSTGVRILLQEDTLYIYEN